MPDTLYYLCVHPFLNQHNKAKRPALLLAIAYIKSRRFAWD